MNNLKYTSFLAYILFFVFFTSCQKEELLTGEEPTAINSEIKLIDEDYRSDLNEFKEIPIVYKEAQYSIENVLTDPELFDVYKNAAILYLDEDQTQGKTFFYIFETDEEVENFKKVRAAKIAMAKNNGFIVSVVTIFDDEYLKGTRFIWDFTRSFNNQDISLFQNLNVNRRNRGSSLEWEIYLPNNNLISYLGLYRDLFERGYAQTVISSYSRTRTFYTLSGNDVDNDIECLSLLIATTN